MAASSAFPVLLTPMTLSNYAGTCNFAEAGWVSRALHDKNVDQRRFGEAPRARSYQDRVHRPYIHLVDGGVSDNLGLRPVIQALTSQGQPVERPTPRVAR